MLGAGIANVLALQDASAPILLIPAINLTAVILGSIAMGAMFNRVKQLERRVDEMTRRGDDDWDRITERRKRPVRKG